MEDLVGVTLYLRFCGIPLSAVSKKYNSFGEGLSFMPCFVAEECNLSATANGI